MSRPVRFPVSCEVAYDYLVAPDNRAAWQSSLKGVDDVLGEDGVVGQSWIDLTTAGVKPRMELTDADRPYRWSERGTWGRFSAILTLTFTPVVGGPAGADAQCEVAASMEVRATGPFKPVGLVVNRLAPLAVRSDLKRAAAILGS
ncbi:SRPBCC family protein [Nocardioides sp.]|uniref:SRPBCC family protein n=1 Tax=Nocardioides sp. TaxID=35761 RepID=UPI002B26716B|nr:SRPBCC family protein [Nocardioides sp.]